MREHCPPLPSVSLIYVQLLTRLQHERRVLLLAQLNLDSFTMTSISSASDEHHTNKVIELDAPYALDHQIKELLSHFVWFTITYPF